MRMNMGRKIAAKSAQKTTLNTITIEDLYYFAEFSDNDYNIKKLREDYGDELTEAQYTRIKEIAKLLKGKVKFGRQFDEEEEEQFLEYMSRNRREYKHAYQCNPEGGDWAILWSKVRLPQATRINKYGEFVKG